MTTQTIPQKFIFNDQEIDFEITGTTVMVNATQMAKIFNKDLFQFTKSDHAKAFINESLKPANAGLLEVKSEEDLIISTQKSGTWMHRILALKFAAWLHPAFELWVYSVIDQILFGHFREMESMLRKSAEYRNRIENIREQLREDPLFTELENLELLEKQTSRLRQRITTDQLSLFRTLPISKQ